MKLDTNLKAHLGTLGCELIVQSTKVLSLNNLKKIKIGHGNDKDTDKNHKIRVSVTI